MRLATLIISLAPDTKDPEMQAIAVQEMTNGT
jgi:hypothetical protein